MAKPSLPQPSHGMSEFSTVGSILKGTDFLISLLNRTNNSNDDNFKGL